MYFLNCLKVYKKCMKIIVGRRQVLYLVETVNITDTEMLFSVYLIYSEK